VIARYDALGRVVHREEQNNGVTDPETVFDYVYDHGVNVAPQVTPTHVLGRLAQATAPTGTVSFSYDDLGRTNARVFTDTTGGIYVEKHAFHGDGTPQSLDLFLPDTGFADEQVLYDQDSAGRGKSVTYHNGSESQTLYTASQIDPFGRVRQAQYGQATFTASYADVGRRLLNQVTVSSLSGSRSIAFQSFDPVDRERGRTETKDGTSTTTTQAYDALGRLSSSVQTTGTTAVSNQQFAYDPLGNLLSQIDTAGGPGAIHTALSYSDTDRDRICRIAYGSDTGTACNVTYDEVGSITSMPTPTGGTRQYSYFVDGSVRSIVDDHATASFRYDAFGQVQELDVTTGAPPFVPDTRHDRRYGELIAWRSASGAQAPILLRKIPGPDGFLATRHGAGGSWVFAFGEQRGNRFFTDQNGAFVQDVDYQPFGKATSTGAQPGSALYSPDQWNYGDALAAFGISQLGARIYDPALGRFLSRDPLLIPATATTTNPYAFANNDPINASDPSGLTIDIDCGKCLIHYQEDLGPPGEPSVLAGSGPGQVNDTGDIGGTSNSGHGSQNQRSFALVTQSGIVASMPSLPGAATIPDTLRFSPWILRQIDEIRAKAASVVSGVTDAVSDAVDDAADAADAANAAGGWAQRHGPQLLYIATNPQGVVLGCLMSGGCSTPFDPPNDQGEPSEGDEPDAKHDGSASPDPFLSPPPWRPIGPFSGRQPEDTERTAAEHRKNPRESNREKHEDGQTRKKRDQGGEKGDTSRRPPRRRPDQWRGPWPPSERPRPSPN
jgi:RHS repeat-associated protein